MQIDRVDPNKRRALHLSLDVDGIDPEFIPGTGTMSRGGLGYREIHYICEELQLTNRLVSMDLVEINPLLDPQGVGENQQLHGDDPDMKATSISVQTGMRIALSALGRSVLELQKESLFRRNRV